MLDVRDEWIKKRAYAIWEEEGHPAGREIAHWEQANHERMALEVSFAHQAETPAAKSKRKSAAGGAVAAKAVMKRGSKKAADARI